MIQHNANSLRELSPDKLQALIKSNLNEEEALELLYHWEFWARENQLPPPGDDWTHWLILAGRGFGKSRMGAEWVRDIIGKGIAKRVALVAPTAADGRDVMIEGESGIMNICHPRDRPHYEPSKRRITWPNGSIATLYTADEPERLRGPQHDAAWCDELCAWRYGQEAWDMLMFGLRLGRHPRTCITTTPKPTKLLKSIMNSSNTVMVRGSTYDNLHNLAPTFKETIIERYEGTRLGRQELMAEVLEDVPGALWTRKLLDENRIVKLPENLQRIVVAVDPPITAGEDSDECGIVAAAQISKNQYVVLEDASSQGESPLEWAKRAINVYNRWNADRIVAEVNQGGAMVEALFKQIDPNIPYKAVHATRGKVVRAEPIAGLYEQGKVAHYGTHETLEDQMCSFTVGFDVKKMGYSPDRVDAVVWALTDLSGRKGVRIRQL